MSKPGWLTPDDEVSRTIVNDLRFAYNERGLPGLHSAARDFEMSTTKAERLIGVTRPEPQQPSVVEELRSALQSAYPALAANDPVPWVSSTAHPRRSELYPEGAPGSTEHFTPDPTVPQVVWDWLHGIAADGRGCLVLENRSEFYANEAHATGDFDTHRGRTAYRMQVELEATARKQQLAPLVWAPLQLLDPEEENQGEAWVRAHPLPLGHQRAVLRVWCIPMLVLAPGWDKETKGHGPELCDCPPGDRRLHSGGSVPTLISDDTKGDG